MRSPLLILMMLVLLAGVTPAQEEDEGPDSPWGVSMGARYMSKYSNYGLDLSNDKPALGFDLGLSHDGGFSLNGGAIRTLGTGGILQQWSLGAGYDWEVAEWLTLSGEYTHYQYANDSVNVLAGLSNALSFSVQFSMGNVDLGLSYDVFPGNRSASYFGLDVSGSSRVGELTIIPMAQAIFMSQTIENRLLYAGKMKKGSSSPMTTISTFTGLSSLSLHLIFLYPLSPGLSLTLHPFYLYSLKEEVSTQTSQILWSAGLRYTLEL